MSIHRDQQHYFGAGPAQLNDSVLQQASRDLLNYENCGLGIGEISHRSTLAAKVIESTKEHLIELMDIPDNYEVFFVQGGGTSAFSSIPTNLSAAFYARTKKIGTAAYAVTGIWSQRASIECKRLGIPMEVVMDSSETFGSYCDIPSANTWAHKLNPKEHSYIYICENETVHGIEWPCIPQEIIDSGVNIVADLSSNILSRKIDVSKYSLIIAGAQKNIGLAGLTVYIIKKSLLNEINSITDSDLRSVGIPITPIGTHYPTIVSSDSAYNTIPTFTLRIIDLVFQHLIKTGGLECQERTNEKKAKILYDSLEKYPSFYVLPVHKRVRSKMNVVFFLKDDNLSEKFLQEADIMNLTGIKGYRSLGGFRASLYNAVELSSVEKLVNFVEKFAKSYGNKVSDH